MKNSIKDMGFVDDCFTAAQIMKAREEDQNRFTAAMQAKKSEIELAKERHIKEREDARRTMVD